MLTVAAICGVFLVVAARSWWRPGAAIALVVCMGAFDQLLAAKSPTFGAYTSFSNFAVAGACLLAVSVAFAAGRFRFRGGLRPALLANVAFFVFFYASAEWAHFTNPEFVLGPIIPYWLLQVGLAPLVLNDEADASEAIRLSYWLCGAAAVYILFDSSAWSADPRRLSLAVAGRPNLSSNPLVLGDIGATAFIFGLLHPAFGRLRSKSALLAYVLCAAGLMVTARAARGETLAAVVSGLLVFVFSRVGRITTTRKPLGVAVVIVLVLTVVGSLLQTGIAERYEADSLSAGMSLRWLMASSVLERFLDSPESWLFGLGAGYARSLFGTYPHNQALQALTETGLVGFTLWATILLSGVAGSLRAWTASEGQSERRYIASCLSAMLCYHLLLSFKRGTVMNPSLFMLAVLADRFALVVLSDSGAKPEAAVPARAAME